MPEKDELNWSKAQLLAKLDVSMGGRVAEELIFGKEHVTTGRFWNRHSYLAYRIEIGVVRFPAFFVG